MEGLAFLLMFAAVLAAFLGIGRWIVQPIDRVAKTRQSRVRFSIADFLCLFLAVQVPLAGVHVLLRDDERGMFWLFTIVTWFVAPVVWYVCAQSLSRAGISTTWHRLVFLGLVLPVVYYGLILFVLLPVAGVIAWSNGEVWTRSSINLRISMWILLGVLFVICGLYTRWLAGQVDLNSENDEFSEPPQSLAVGE